MFKYCARHFIFFIQTRSQHPLNDEETRPERFRTTLGHVDLSSLCSCRARRLVSVVKFRPLGKERPSGKVMGLLSSLPTTGTGG